MLLPSENQVFFLSKCLVLVTHVWECVWLILALKKNTWYENSGSPQLWSFLDHKWFCHLRGGSSHEPAWPSAFPRLLFKMIEKGKCCSFFFFFAYLFFSWNRRKELNQNLGLNSLMPHSHGYMCFEPSPSRTRIFSSFLLGHTCFFPLLCLVVSFWSPALSWLHPDPSLPWVWVTRAITLPASTYSVPQLLG